MYRPLIEYQDGAQQHKNSTHTQQCRTVQNLLAKILHLQSLDFQYHLCVIRCLSAGKLHFCSSLESDFGSYVFVCSIRFSPCPGRPNQESKWGAQKSQFTYNCSLCQSYCATGIGFAAQPTSTQYLQLGQSMASLSLFALEFHNFSNFFSHPQELMHFWVNSLIRRQYWRNGVFYCRV